MILPFDAERAFDEENDFENASGSYNAHMKNRAIFRQIGSVAGQKEDLVDVLRTLFSTDIAFPNSSSNLFGFSTLDDAFIVLQATINQSTMPLNNNQFSIL